MAFLKEKVGFKGDINRVIGRTQEALLRRAGGLYHRYRGGQVDIGVSIGSQELY